MLKQYARQLLAVGAVLALPTLSRGASVQSFEDLQGRELTMRATEGAHRKIYLPSSHGEAFVLHQGNRLFPLRAPEPVQVTKVTRKDDRVEVRVASARLGKGRLEFYGQPASGVDLQRWLDEVFELTVPTSEFRRYVGNTHSHVLHRRGSNHAPAEDSQQHFHAQEEALSSGYRRCGVCFMPNPDVSGYDNERALAMMSLQQVRSAYHPLVDSQSQGRVQAAGDKVLAHWPVPLKGYRYRFQVMDSDDVNAFAVPTGYIFVTRGLIDAVESEDELAAILAHEVTHVENRHTYRQWRKAQLASAIIGVLGALAGSKDEDTGDAVTAMSALVANVFLSGFGRDREREADSFASAYLSAVGASNQPLHNVLAKLKYSNDMVDPLGNSAGGPFATHPHIDERLAKAADTQTRLFEGSIFDGLSKSGQRVATLSLEMQRFHDGELEIIATIATTAELGKKDKVNTLTLTVGGKSFTLKERTAESVFPGDEVSGLFATKAPGLLDAQVTGVKLKLRNVVQWTRVGPSTGS